MEAGQRFKDALQGSRPLLAGGAHDGLSALLVEEAGFDAVWASGFEISAAHGVPDANILTMSDNLRAAAMMVQACRLPVVADCDNGYGNAINVIHTVRAYEREGVAAICIEDNVFPKRCSFYAGVKRELAAVEEHAGKVKACVDTRRSETFLIIARTEALIAGWGMQEALRRGRAYADAGADLVLIHSKSQTAGEVLEFARRWDRPTPLVCVPTIYRDVTATELGQAGFRLIIYANHGLRSAIKAMRETFRRLIGEGKTAAADDMIVPLEDVYQLIGVPNMKQEETSYLPGGGAEVHAVILAAGSSPELGELTADRPKSMLDIKGTSLLSRQVASLNHAGIKDVSVVLDYHHEAVEAPNVKTYLAPGTRGEVASLFQAAPEWRRRSVILYGDILFDGEIVSRLLQCEGDIVLVVDRATGEGRANRDLVRTENGVDARGRLLQGGRIDRLEAIGRDLPQANGEWIGMLMVSEEGAQSLLRAYDRLRERGNGAVHQARSLEEAALTDLLQVLVEGGTTIDCIDTYKGWMEIDTFEDYRRAWSLLS